MLKCLPRIQRLSSAMRTQELDRRQVIYLLLLAILFGAFLSFGYDLSADGFVDYTSPILYIAWAGSSICLFGLLACWFSWQMKRGRRLHSWTPRERCKFLLLAATIVVLVWAVVLLAAWPGFYVYDTDAFIEYMSAGVLSTFQPAFHTLFVSTILSAGLSLFGSFNWAVALYVVVQQFICLLILLLLFDTLIQKDVSRMGVALCILYFAVNPYIAILTACTSKDILFSYYLVGFLTVLMRQYFGIGRRTFNVILSGIFVFLLLVYRNNALPALLVFAVLAFFVLRNSKHKIVFFFAPLAIGFFAYFIFSGPISAALGVEKSNAFQEMISIPAMEIAHTCQESDEMRKLVDAAGIDSELLVSSYSVSPSNSDGVRVHFWDTLNSDGPLVILKLWAQARLIDFWGCFEADMLITSASWNPFAVMDGYEGYYQTATPSYGFSPIAESPAVQESKIPVLYDAIYRLSRFNDFEHTGILYPVMSVFPYVWLLILACVASLAQRNNLGTVITILPLLLVMTNWLGPIVLLRYYLYLPLLLPIFAYCSFVSATTLEAGKERGRPCP